MPFLWKKFETSICRVSSGMTRSCGCYIQKQRHCSGRKNAKDLTGLRSGKLVALEKSSLRSQRKIKWKCQCDCGKICYVASSDLINGHTQSCGCLRSGGEEKISKILKGNGVLFEREANFPDCKNPRTGQRLRFDFYLPDFGVFIECNGLQHYQPVDFYGGESEFQNRIKLDEIKRSWIKQKGFCLLEIKYKQKSDIDDKEILDFIFN